jgi:hypothetical protein
MIFDAAFRVAFPKTHGGPNRGTGPAVRRTNHASLRDERDTERPESQHRPPVGHRSRQRCSVFFPLAPQGQADAVAWSPRLTPPSERLVPNPAFRRCWTALCRSGLPTPPVRSPGRRASAAAALATKNAAWTTLQPGLGRFAYGSRSRSRPTPSTNSLHRPRAAIGRSRRSLHRSRPLGRASVRVKSEPTRLLIASALC